MTDAQSLVIAIGYVASPAQLFVLNILPLYKLLLTTVYPLLICNYFFFLYLPRYCRRQFQKQSWIGLYAGLFPRLFQRLFPKLFPRLSPKLFYVGSIISPSKQKNRFCGVSNLITKN